MSFSPCFTHGLKANGLVNELHRASHVLQVGTYWLSLVTAVRALVSKVVVLHYADIDEHDTKVARHVLELTLGKGLPYEMLDNATKKQIDDILFVLPFAWNDNEIKYLCRVEGCSGGRKCKSQAVITIMDTLHNSMFAFSVIVPVLSRWWKVTPLARQVLLGIAINNLWGRASPKAEATSLGGLTFEDIPADPSEIWRDTHNANVNKTFEFFNSTNIVPLLVIMLQSLQPSHLVMAWVMKYCVTGHQSSIFRNKSLQPIIDYVHPTRSVLFKALKRGGVLLSDRDAWVALFASCKSGNHSYQLCR